MRVIGRVIQLICGLVVVVLGLTNEGLLAAGIFPIGLLIIAWAIWDIYRETNPDKRKVSDLDKRIESLKDPGENDGQ